MDRLAERVKDYLQFYSRKLVLFCGGFTKEMLWNLCKLLNKNLPVSESLLCLLRER